MVEYKRMFIDTSKQVFQLHGVDAREEPALRGKLRRGEMLAFFAKLPATLVGPGSAFPALARLRPA
jgi:transposase